uniref:Solute carrier family 22 member 7 n=1 Tax=Strix occidentalis caurina TaxID=311401 RepID=A0A8D0FXV9_STROC
MKFEDLLLEIGGFGRFQIFILFILCLPRINLPMHFLLHNFLAATPSHHCAIPHQEAFVNLTMEEVLLISIPQEPDGTYSSCEMFSQPQFHLLLNSSLQPENNSIIQHCQHGWVYDHSQFTSTISTQWDLVCEQRGLNQATATFFFIGVTMGAVIFGYLSDRFGRKAMLLVSLVFSVIFGMLSAASVSYSMLAITRTLTGVALSGVSLIILPFGMEWVDIQHRTFSGILTSIFWSIGNMLLAMVAYLVREWHWLLVAVTGPCLLSIVCLWWVPESARWLIANGKVKQAQRHLLQCARMNGRKDFTRGEGLFPSFHLSQALRRMSTNKKPGQSYSYISLFRTPVLRKISLCSGAVWFGVAFSYYGMSMNLTGFGLNMYLSQFLLGIVEIPAKMIMYVLVNRVGRRQSQAWALILTGLSIGANVIIPKSETLFSFTSLRPVVAIMGKGFSEAAFTTVFLYTSELYPTILRQNGMGYTSFVARLGGALAPLVFLLDEVWRSLPEVMYCGVAVCCGSVAFLLPETLNVRLPEGIEDIEKAQ